MTIELLPAPPATRSLGPSLTVSSLSWGMWRFTEDEPSTAHAAKLVQHVLDAGISLLDTADIYGFNGTDGFGAAETLLGKVIAQTPSLRERMVLATKGGIRPPLPYDQSAAYLAGTIDASLRRLQVEYIDLWQIHRPDILAHPQEVARVMDDAVAQGKIRALGVSNFTTAQITTLQHFLDQPLVATQPEISPLCIDCFENGELDQAMLLGMTPLAWSPIGGGRLSDPQSERDRAVAHALDAVAAEYGVERSVAAYSWLMAHPSGIVPIIGSQNPARVSAAVGAFNVRWTRQSWYDVLIAARGKRLP